MPLGITGRLYVSGSYLFWEDAETTIDERRNAAPQAYKFTGALPTDGNLFAGQPSGRIWVSNHLLYYSDAAGVTRFIQGIKRSVASSSPAGRIYAHRYNKAQSWEPIQPATDLFWVGVSASSNVWYSVRNDTSLNPAEIKVGISNYGDKGIIVSLLDPDNLASLKESNFDIRIQGGGIVWYTSSNCTTAGIGNTYEQWLDVLIPKGQTAVYQCPDTGNGGSGITYYYYPSQSNGCPAVNIGNSQTSNSWKVFPYIAGNPAGGTMLLGAYTGSTYSGTGYTPGGQYYISSQSQTINGTFHYQAYNASYGASNTWEMYPLALGIDRVTMAYEGLACSGTGGGGGCGAGSGSCNGTCYPLATKGCCGTTIYDLATQGCCGTTAYTFDGTQLCCGSSLFTYGPGYYSICCGITACAWVDGNEVCVNGTCQNGSQP